MSAYQPGVLTNPGTYYQSLIVSWCGGELRVDQWKKCANICDVAQVTGICTLSN